MIALLVARMLFAGHEPSAVEASKVSNPADMKAVSGRSEG
jgi:hypothetical protein